jgi:prepilin-type N-terminal cleavage/methylation domain-containing protein
MKCLIFIKKRANGMTLLEMVVVIAIISLLAALLMPAVGKAMIRAKRTVCHNNQRQVYLMLIAQASGNDNRLPSAAPIQAAGIFPITDPIRIIEANITNSASQKILLCPGDRRKYPSKLKDLSYYWNRLSLGKRIDEIQPTSRLASEKWFWHETQPLIRLQPPTYSGRATTLRGDGSTGFEKIPLPVLPNNRK